MIEQVYFVISLPRSGTTSICKMAKICNLKPNHAPHASLKSRIIRKEYNFFSDTPVFCPKEIHKICEINEIDPKFIYIDRDFFQIFDSWKRVKLFNNYQRMYSADFENMRPTMKFDLESYNDAFNNNVLTENNYNEIFYNHKTRVIDAVKKNNKELLIYRFEEGWEPFCEFVNCAVPKEEIPNLNKDKMFDKI
jgi:hypothetical protein